MKRFLLLLTAVPTLALAQGVVRNPIIAPPTSADATLALQRANAALAAVADKANTSDLSTLSDTVSTKANQADLTLITTALNQKALQSDLAAVQTLVSSKALNSDLTALQTLVSSKATLTQLNAKADQTDLDDLNTLAHTKANTSDLTQLQTLVSSKAFQSDVTALTTALNGKADTSALSAKANLTDLNPITTALNTKANLSDLAQKANLADLNTIQTAVDMKATQADLNAALTTLNTKATLADLAAKASQSDLLTTISTLNTKANQSDLALKANVSAIPAPSDALPNMESTTSSAGTSTTYLRSNYVPIRITRAAKVLTDASGNWTITWAKPMPAAPVTLPIPMNTTGSATITCNVVTSTATGSTGYCTQTRPLPATLTLLTNLVNYVITQIAPTGTVVQVFALPTTD